jgi:hypothetical protein
LRQKSDKRRPADRPYKSSQIANPITANDPKIIGLYCIHHNI